MENLLRQITKGLDVELYQMCLSLTVCLPDICSALDSEDGTANRTKYKAWFHKYLHHKYKDRFTADDCYYFRCSFLHQGSSQHEKINYRRILFVEPNSPIDAHCANVNGALVLNVVEFCIDMVKAVINWLEDVRDSDNFQRNYKRFLKRYPNGISPYFVGHPIIT